ncbi:MAG: esterase/lipase family protein [Burkholderiales bacterium]
MASTEIVLLVHGLWMHGVAMRLMQHRLERNGFAVRAYSYPTVRMNLHDNALRLARYCATLTGSRLHFVGHSMGGVVALKAAELLPDSTRGRVVLIGTPFADSYSGRQLDRVHGGRLLLGRCMNQWLKESQRQAVGDLDVGVVAGDGGFGMGRIIAPGLPKPHDGVISVDETRVPGMRDHVTLRVSHTAMLVSRPVLHQVCAYLKHGRFDRAEPNTIT